MCLACVNEVVTYFLLQTTSAMSTTENIIEALSYTLPSVASVCLQC